MEKKDMGRTYGKIDDSEKLYTH